MKKAMFFVALASSAALAEDAYIFPVGPVKVGQAVERQFPATLFLESPCTLSLANAKNYRHYASFMGKWDVGCWAKTIDGNAVIVVPNLPTKTVSLSVLPLADVKKDGTTVIKALPTYGR